MDRLYIWMKRKEGDECMPGWMHRKRWVYRLIEWMELDRRIKWTAVYCVDRWIDR